MPHILPSKQQVVGEIIDATGPDGNTIKVIMPGVTLLDSTGNPAAASGAPPGTGTVTSVASSASSIALAPANANRKGATIINTDANPLKVLLSVGTASETNYSVEVAPGGYYEVPYGYTGAIFGVWDVDGTGAALVTELT